MSFNAFHGTFLRSRSFIPRHLGVVAAGLAIVLNPIVNRRTANQVENIRFQAEQNDIPDDVPLVIAGDELLGLVRAEVLKRVDSEVGQQFQRIRTLHVHVGHVIRLVKQNAGLLPCALLIPPIGVLARHYRIHVGSDR
jgi:hypothetical protein